MKRIAVLLTVFNRKEKTLKCLENLYSQLPIEGYGVDVYLTNDGCTDGTPEAVAELFPQVNIIHSKGDLFWNRGMYAAWKAAAKAKDYDYYLWLNDDTNIYNGSLVKLLATAETCDNKVIVVGTTCAVKNPDEITYGGRSVKHGLLKPSNEIQSCDYFNGNIVLFPSYVYRKVGMNNPVFHHALGDFDYGLRAGKLGVKSVVASGILGECDEHETLATWCNPQVPFAKRWKAFKTPLGQNPDEFFIFEKRHHGLLKACFHYVTNYMRVCFPRIWNLK